MLTTEQPNNRTEGGGTVVVLDDSFEKTDLEQKIKDSLAATDVLLVGRPTRTITPIYCHPVDISDVDDM